MIKYTCTACGKEHQIGNEFGGRQAKCPACGSSLKIPEKPPEAISDKALEALVGKVAAITPPAASAPESSAGSGLALVWKVLGAFAVAAGLIWGMVLVGKDFLSGLTVFLEGLGTGLLFYTFGVVIDLLTRIEKNTRK